jgi:hypothetical protein
LEVFEVIRLCAVLALGCALGLSSVAAAEATAAPGAGGQAKLRYAEQAARQAVAPLPAERVVCWHRSRRTVGCFVLHQASGPRQCRSVVLVGKRRTRVAMSNVCFEFAGVRP